VAGLLQKSVTGKFRIMPTQGGYSLWAGNRPGANGRYFEQKIHLVAGTAGEGDNPARIESEILYQRETGEIGPPDPDRVNHFWRAKTLTAIKADPARLLRLMVLKAYFLFNNFEQYNNKTYAVQKSLSPVLMLNPLGWGVTLVLCAAGLPLLWLGRRHFRGGFLIWSVAALYGLGVVLFFVSDRFRLPLLAFLCIGACGWGCVWNRRWNLQTTPLLSIGATALAGTLLAFSNAWGVRDMTPAVQDYVALSMACGKAGDDMNALKWARKALDSRPHHPDALARAMTSFFNCQLGGLEPMKIYPAETWELQLTRFAQMPQPAAGTKLVQAVAPWKTGRLVEAKDFLENITKPAASDNRTPAASDDALGVLLLTGLANFADEELARDRAQTTGSLYLLSALARREGSLYQLVPVSRRNMVADLAPYVHQIFP
jgi:hypothetical protein